MDDARKDEAKDREKDGEDNNVARVSSGNAAQFDTGKTDINHMDVNYTWIWYMVQGEWNRKSKNIFFHNKKDASYFDEKKKKKLRRVGFLIDVLLSKFQR